MIGLSVAVVSATQASFAFTGLGGDGVVDLQISPVDDFQFCVCPIYQVPRASPYLASGLNQRATLYARARNRAASGEIDEWSNLVGFRTADGPPQNHTPPAVLIEPSIIVAPDAILAFADPAGESVAGFPMANLRRDAPVAWRGQTATGAHDIYFQTAGAPIDTIAILNTNLPEVAAVTITAATTLARVQAGANLAFQGDLQSFRASANLPGRRGYHGLWRLGAPVAAPWWRLAFAAVSTPANTMHAEHLVAGLNRSSRNHAVEKTETPSTRGSLERRRSGAADRLLGAPIRKVDFELQNLTVTQYETIYADLLARQGQPILVVPNSRPGPYLHDRILYGDLSGGRVVNPVSPRFNRSFTVDSLI